MSPENGETPGPEETHQVVASPPRSGAPPAPLAALAILAIGGLIGALGLSALVASARLEAPPLPRDQLVLVGGIGLMLGTGLAAIGLGILTFAPVWQGPAVAAAGFGTHRVMLTTTAFAVLLASMIQAVLALLLSRITGVQDFQNIQSFPGLLLAASSTGCSLLGVGYFRFVRPGVVPIAWFGFRRNHAARYFGKSVWLAHLLTGIGGWFLILLVSLVVQVVLGKFGVQQTQLLGFTWVSELSSLQFIVILLVGAGLASFAEEFYFRGILFRGYLEARGPTVAYLATSVIFGSLHLNAQAFLPLAALGMVLAWLYRATGSVVPGMLAHSINNALAFVVVYYQVNGPGGM